MAQLKRNNADGGTDTVGVTAGNSGGASGDAFDVVLTSAGHTYSNFGAGSSPQGGLLYWINTLSLVSAYNEWAITATEFWGSGYFRFAPASGGSATNPVEVFVAAYGAADAQAASLTFDHNTGKITVTGQTGGGSATGTGVHIANQWMRIDWHFKLHASAGVAEARVYNDVVGAPNTFETITETSAATLGTMAKLRIGLINTPDYSRWVAADDLIIDDAAWVNRDTSPPPWVRPQSNIYRM